MLDNLINLKYRLKNRNHHLYRSVSQILHIDWPLLVGLVLLVGFGLFILYSAADQDIGMVLRQGVRILVAFCVMGVLAQITPLKYQDWAPWIYAITLVLLLIVLLVGVIGKGAQRWLSLWLFQFQPSELMKLALPLMLAWYLKSQPLPPKLSTLFTAGLIILTPVLIVAKQPDLGTALLLMIAGFGLIFLAGLSYRWLIGLVLLIAACVPAVWHFLHDYQRERVLTFLNPERDPLGSGYHIIQSKIAVGAGGLFGKGWLNGTQSHLQFLPEHATDFIFAVCGEELGFIGSLALLILYLFIIGRGLYISFNAQDTFSRLLAGGISLSFFISAVINIGMVIGILPVVGLPLPLVSYGGTSFITLIASFGILMSIQTHRRLIGA